MDATDLIPAPPDQQDGPPPAEPGPEPVAARFARLAAEWRKRTEYISSVTARAKDPAYQEVIGMGWDVVPVIIDELRRDPDWWFVALRRITGENPVPAEARAKLDLMARAWVEWWDRSHGR